LTIKGIVPNNGYCFIKAEGYIIDQGSRQSVQIYEADFDIVQTF